jgi:hypothetical protein
VILGLGLLSAVLVTFLAILGRGGEPRLGLVKSLLLAPVVWATLFGVFRLGSFVTQRDLPAPLFVTPMGAHAIAAGLGAAATLLFLWARWWPIQLLSGWAAIVVGSMAVNYHASFGDSEIRIRPSLSPSERCYRYDQVQAVMYVTHKVTRHGLVLGPRYVIDFSDGGRWTSQDGLRDYVYPFGDMQSVVEVAHRSDRMLQQVLTVPER